MSSTRGRKAASITPTNEELTELVRWSKSRSLSHSLVMRARIILAAASGMSNVDIVADLGLDKNTVGKWRRRFAELGLRGLDDAYRPGRPRTYKEERVAKLIKETLETKPKGQTHWSCRTMAEHSGISASTVGRTWRMFNVQPHLTKGFKISTDPLFVERVKDVVGLYLSPPENAVVLAVDEKSQCQALERTQPILPLGMGYAEGVTDNYFRHGTTTLFAALDVATGEVETACMPRHRHQEFLAFLKQIDAKVPAGLDIHVILDNYATHKHPKIIAYLANHPRFEFHFTPTYSSWLNQVERWFGLITEKAIRRGSFSSVKKLIQKIDEFTKAYNERKKPFTWTATAEEIFAKLARLCTTLNPERNTTTNL